MCPFGGLETLWRWFSTGQFVPRTHLSNLVIGLGLLLSTLLAGGAFCGWVCPFGALQASHSPAFGASTSRPRPAVWTLWVAGAHWMAYAIALVVLIAFLFVERAWCRYACPLGGAISLLGKASLLRIRRTDAACKSCAVKLNVTTAEAVSSNCIGNC